MRHRHADRLNHAANASPRSGSSKKVAPIAFAVILLVAVAVAIWLKAYA